MAASLFKLGFKSDGGLERIKLLSKTWPSRVRKLMELLTLDVTEFARKEIVGRLPQQDQYRAYKHSLETVQVVGGEKEEVAYAVRAPLRHRKVRKMDVRRVVLYVKPKRKLARESKEVTVLMKYNPWTLDTIPFTPKKRDAVVVSRRVGKTEVKRIAESRKRQAPVWRKELHRAGFREIKKTRRLKLPKTMKTLPDVVFEALRLEYGLGGVKPHPHWRPGIRTASRQGMRYILRRREAEIARTLLDSGYHVWKGWPRPVKKIRVMDAEKFKGFQEKLGLRF
jgi:hypothetical protein